MHISQSPAPVLCFGAADWGSQPLEGRDALVLAPQLLPPPPSPSLGLAPSPRAVSAGWAPSGCSRQPSLFFRYGHPPPSDQYFCSRSSINCWQIKPSLSRSVISSETTGVHRLQGRGGISALPPIPIRGGLSSPPHTISPGSAGAARGMLACSPGHWVWERWFLIRVPRAMLVLASLKPSWSLGALRLFLQRLALPWYSGVARKLGVMQLQEVWF